MTRIPPRQPVSDDFEGFALRVDGQVCLAHESFGTVLAQGALTVRYGARYLGKSFLSIVPGLVALDYGDFLTADAAWDFIRNRSNLYPRAEVFGFRSDGVDDMTWVRNLDLARPAEVLVYADATATRPLASVDALIVPAAALERIPARLRAALPHVETFDDWRAAKGDR
jgi:hypothetical protein